MNEDNDVEEDARQTVALSSTTIMLLILKLYILFKAA